MKDILENFHKDFNKTNQINFDKKHNINNQNSLNKQDYLKKYDILLTDSNLYTINNSKLFKSNLLSRLKLLQKSRIKQKFLPFPILDNLKLDNYKKDIIQEKNSIQEILKESKTNTVDRDNSTNKNKTISTFYNTTFNIHKNPKSINELRSYSKRDHNYKKFINEESDIIVGYLLQCKNPSEFLNSSKKSKDYSNKEKFEQKKGKSLKMPTIKNKFLVEPSDDKFIRSKDVHIKNFGSEEYRNNLLKGVSHYYFKSKDKHDKERCNIKKHPELTKKLLKSIKTRQNLRLHSKKNKKEYKDKFKKDKNFYLNKFIDNNMKNKSILKGINTSFDQRTDMIIDSIEQLEKFVKNRINTHRRMKVEIENM